MRRIVHRRPGETVQLWFQDEARVGQKGRNARVWYEKGLRPLAPTDKRFKSVYIHGAVRAGTDDAFAPGVHAVLVMDKAGWHVTGRLDVPPNVGIVHLPPYSPELNPVERVWLHLKERYLSHRVFPDVPAIIEACARAWNDLVADTGRIASLTRYPYLKQVKTS